MKTEVYRVGEIPKPLLCRFRDSKKKARTFAAGDVLTARVRDIFGSRWIPCTDRGGGDFSVDWPDEYPFFRTKGPHEITVQRADDETWDLLDPFYVQVRGDIPATVPIYPGLEGFGIYTKAGRGGTIYRVTSLADTGPGTLREALEASGPRQVIFETSGTIELVTRIYITDPNVSVYGQTAPSPGITIKNQQISIEASDVFIQHVRSRVGIDVAAGDPEPGNFDTFIVGPTVYGIHNVVLDHCSLSWTTDEIVSIGSRYAQEILFSNCIMSEALNDSVHPDGPHPAGPLIGRNTSYYLLYRNLLAHNGFRNPRSVGNTRGLVVNNVIYDTHQVYSEVASPNSVEPLFLSYVGNKCIKGPSRIGGADYWALVIDTNVDDGTKIYVEDNIDDKTGSDPWDHVKDMSPGGVNPKLAAPPVWVDPLSVLPASEIEDDVAANAGARPWDRDPVDERIIEELATRTGAIIDDPSDVGGFPVLAVNTVTHELPSDPHGEAGNGYTNFEAWIHENFGGTS